LSSCRRDPVAADQFIVALVSPSEVSGQTAKRDDGEHFDLDVVIWNQRMHAVAAHRRDAGYFLRIERIFATQVELLTDDGNDPGCLDATRAIRTTVGTTTTQSHGYADLSVVTQDVTASDVPGKPCGPAKIEKHQTSYDGATYGPVAIRMYLHPFD
jgi:hypothetical protein